jgi:phosphopantothenate--cysteine ligase
MKKILITAGGTREYIDDVRVLTNISTGNLGAQIALDASLMEDTLVYYVHATGCVLPEHLGLCSSSRILYYPVKTAQDTLDVMKKLIIEEEIDVVIHSMAVSDFTFKRDGSIKLKSNDPEAFIEFMRKSITPNPKIISHIKEWRPETILIGFKFEVDIDHQKLIALARASIEKNGCDLVIANDKSEMKKINSHVAYFVFSDEASTKHNVMGGMVFNKKEIATKIIHYLKRIL